MRLAMPEREVRGQLIRQLSSLYRLEGDELRAIDGCWEGALGRIETCFSHVRNKYYSRDGQTLFDPLHGCQWAHFLYTLSNEVYRQGGPRSACDKVYLLSKMVSGADMFYEVELPEVFVFDHPVGTVLGRGVYGNHFMFMQGCNVGQNHGIYPRIGDSVFMMSNSKVLGDCRIGDNVILSANSYVIDTDIPSGSIVFGQGKDLVIKEAHYEYVRDYALSVFGYDD